MMTWKAHAGQVRGVAFSPDGARLATHAFGDSFARLWDAVTGKERHRYDFGIGKVQCACFAPDGLTCAAAGLNGKVVIWDVDS